MDVNTLLQIVLAVAKEHRKTKSFNARLLNVSKYFSDSIVPTLQTFDTAGRKENNETVAKQL
jgi:hypothetical protein